MKHGGIGVRWLPALFACGLPLVPTGARAAWETEVLTAAEKGNPLDLNLSLGFDRKQKKAKITREWVQEIDGTLQQVDVKELRYEETQQRLLLGLRLGLYHDLEFHALAPIVLSSDTLIRFAIGTEGASTIIGSPNADDPNHVGVPRYPITGVMGEEGQRYRAGFGDMVFGLAWSPFVDDKDEAWPTLTLRGDITVPTGAVRDPVDQNALRQASRGSIGLGQTIFDLSIAVSRRMGEATPAFDPYLVFGATIPISNAAQRQKGMEAPATGRFIVGTEIIVHENEKDFQRYGVDFSFETRYIGTGRTYSELSDYLPAFDQTKILANRPQPVPGDEADDVFYNDFDNRQNYGATLDGARCGKVEGVPCGELNMVDEHLTLMGTFAVHLRFAEFALLRTGVAYSHATDHFLTNERVGKDLDPPGTQETCDGAPCAGKVNARNSFYDRTTNTCASGKTCDERSKYYDPRYDAPGRRFRIEEEGSFTFFISGVATF
jgi:hypothetical protein